MDTTFDDLNMNNWLSYLKERYDDNIKGLEKNLPDIYKKYLKKRQAEVSADEFNPAM